MRENERQGNQGSGEGVSGPTAQGRAVRSSRSFPAAVVALVLLLPSWSSALTYAADDAETALRQRIIARAASHLGTAYVAGGGSSSGVDCSGLVLLVARELGLPLDHRYTSADFERLALPDRLGIPIDQVRPGDLIAWNRHVAIVYENRSGRIRLLHAVRRSGRVIISDLEDYAAPGKVAIRTVRGQSFLLAADDDWASRGIPRATTAATHRSSWTGQPVPRDALFPPRLAPTRSAQPPCPTPPVRSHRIPGVTRLAARAILIRLLAHCR
jgi:cell wall-associated NlpC family hydrolase